MASSSKTYPSDVSGRYIEVSIRRLAGKWRAGVAHPDGSPLDPDRRAGGTLVAMSFRPETMRGAPVAVIWGPMSPQKFGPYGTRSLLITRPASVYPEGASFMSGITVEQAWAELQGFLDVIPEHASRRSNV